MMYAEEILKLSALELGSAIKAGRTTAVEALEAVLWQIEKYEDQYHCFITVDKEGARERARRVQADIEAGILRGPLAGVPFAVKDNLCTAGMKTTCASKMLEDFVPAYTAGAVEKLLDEGAILIGKTNMDEFAMGSSTETSFFGPTKNPKDITRTPGGSSGGSAAAVAAGECFLALGSDTGGSVRQPASHCGVVGLKPTYGSVSRFGLVAYASSLDQVGQLAKNVSDCACLYRTVQGKDVRDATSRDVPPSDCVRACGRGVEGLRIGVPEDYLALCIAPEVKRAVQEAVEVLCAEGALAEKITLGYSTVLSSVYYTLAMAEASSNLARYDGVKYGYGIETAQTPEELYRKSRTKAFGSEVKRRIIAGTYVLSEGFYDAYYLKAMKLREQITAHMKRIFATYDCIILPVAPSVAGLLGEVREDQLAVYREDVFTVLANLTGCPALSVPFAETGEGLPAGVQLVADAFCEETLFRAAGVLEAETKKGGIRRYE